MDFTTLRFYDKVLKPIIPTDICGEDSKTHVYISKFYADFLNKHEKKIFSASEEVAFDCKRISNYLGRDIKICEENVFLSCSVLLGFLVVSAYKITYPNIEIIIQSFIAEFNKRGIEMSNFLDIRVEKWYIEKLLTPSISKEILVNLKRDFIHILHKYLSDCNYSNKQINKAINLFNSNNFNNHLYDSNYFAIIDKIRKSI